MGRRLENLAATLALVLPSCVVSFPDYPVGRLDASAGTAGTVTGGAGGVTTGGVGAAGAGANTGGGDASASGGSGGVVADGSSGSGGSDAALDADASGTDAGDAASDACVPGTVYLYEPFANNDAGWTLGTEWEIGPALQGPPPSRGSPDPAQDHTATSDNGIAGVVIGGNATTMRHAPYYLASPAIDLSSAGTVKLSFWRWLNSDSGGYISDTIDVWNGSTWVNLWTNPVGNGLLITDNAWMPFEYDVTQYKNAAFQVRFGIAVVQTGAYSMSSWNLDDIVVSSPACP